MAHMQNAPTSVLAVALVVLLLLIAFSSGTEVAMLSANRYKVRTAAKSGKRTAKALDALLSRPDSWLGANLVILALASVAASSIVTLLAQRTGYEHAIPIAGGALAVFMIVFCELAPKIYAALKPDPVALSSTYIYKVLVFLMTPFSWFANKAAYGFLRLFGVKPVTPDGTAMSAEELRTVVAEAGPMIPTRHRQMLLSILDLEHITVNDIMVPRQEIASINVEDSWEDILDQLRQTPHTRLPLCEDGLDNVTGMIHMKKVAHALARDGLSREMLLRIAREREAYFVPEGTTLDVQLQNFQRDRRRIALVVDEYGDIRGLVTLEDILEEIVGEFTSDPGTLHRDIHRDADGSYVVNGAISVRILNRTLGWSLPTKGPRTLNGLILEYLENIPEPGTTLRLGNLSIEILQAIDNAVKTARIRLIDEEENAHREET